MRYLIKQRFTPCLLLAACLFITACATTDKPEVKPEKDYYDAARKALDSRNFNEAKLNLDSLETYYPFGRYSEQSQLDLIYARYESIDLEGARSAADRFLRLQPQSKGADYALYMRGLASYNLDLGLSLVWFPVEQGARDPGEQRKAFRDFAELLTRYPGSVYAPDAQKRMFTIRNRLADLELTAANYYLVRQAYLAAVNRARYILENFPETPTAEKALIILVEGYRLLGMQEAADNALTLLAINFPDSKAFDAQQRFVAQVIKPQDRSLLSAVTFGWFGGEDQSAETDDAVEPDAPAVDGPSLDDPALNGPQVPAPPPLDGDGDGDAT